MNSWDRKRHVLTESSTNTTRCTKRKSYIQRLSAFYLHRPADAAVATPTFDEEVYPILGTPPRLCVATQKTKVGGEDPFDDLVVNTDALVRHIESLKRQSTRLARRIDAEKKKAANVEQMLRSERKKNIEMTVRALDR